MTPGAEGILDQALQELRLGHCVALVGPPGIGKSTAVAALADRWRADGGAVHEGALSASAQRVSLAGLAGLLARHTATLGAAVDDLRRLPGLLVLDDAHLLDEQSAVAVHTVASERPVLLSLRDHHTGTPDAIERLVASPRAVRIAVPPLGLAEATRLLEARLGGAVDRTSIRALCEASEGNPLLLHELTTSGLAAGSIGLRHGVWRCHAVVARTSVRQVYRERVASWPDAPRQVITAVAVAEAVPEELLCACFGQRGVHEAQLLDAIRPDRAGRNLVPRHGLLRDAVLADLSPVDRSDLLARLVEAADRSPCDGVTLLQRGLWLLALGEDGRADPDLVIGAADMAFDSLQTSLAVELSELALRLRPGAPRAREIIARAAASSGAPPASDEDPGVLVEALKGRFEWFSFGAVPVGELRAELARTFALVDHPVDVLKTSVVSACLDWKTGQHADAALDRLVGLAQSATDEPEVAAIAMMFAGTAALFGGRLDHSIELVRDAPAGDNPFHLARRELTTTQALLRLGRHREAELHAAALRNMASGTNLAAKLFALVVDAQLDLQRGDAHGAVRTLGAITGELDALDPVGIASWARVWLGAALAWTGTPGAAETHLIGPHAIYLASEIRLGEALHLAEIGRLVDARELALALFDDAVRRGDRMSAMWLALLAQRIHPTRACTSLVTEAARSIDGEVARVAVDFAAALADDDGPGLEKSADRFTEVGFVSLAHDGFVLASRLHRQAGARTAAARAASAASRLEEDGCVPSFAVRGASSGPVELTVREREVALAVCEGLPHRHVADALGISARTVETHLHRAYRKLGVTNADELRRALDG